MRQIKNLTFLFLSHSKVLLLYDIDNAYCYKIIDTLAPHAATFDFPKLEQLHMLLSYCMRNQDCQQHLFACPDLLYDQIASIVTQNYQTEDGFKAAFIFVGSTFNFGTSDRYADTIIKALKMIPESEQQSYLIFKIVSIMPEKVFSIGTERTIQSIYNQLATDDEELITQALLTLIQVIKQTKGRFKFEFEPVFSKLEYDNVDIPVLTYNVLSVFADVSKDGSKYLIEQGIFQRCFEEAQSIELPMRRRIECVRIIANILHKIDSSNLLELINLDIVHIFCEVLEIEEFLFLKQIIDAIFSIFSAKSEELSQDTFNIMEEEESWQLINEYSSSTDFDLSNSATTLLSTFYVPLPDDDDDI